MPSRSLFERLSTALGDRYEAERPIGAGAMASVFLAEDLRHHRPVAIKVLDPELAEAVGPDRFLREIEIAANLTHPHILPVHDSGEADGLLYFVMPFVAGESLRARLDREKQLPIEDAVRIAREVADALGYAHQQGVVHRDVKPANILIESRHAVLADFGVAAALAGGRERTRLTQTGVSLGTPTYMSPEQGAGEESVDGRSDLYSLGCVLYEMLAGHPPFSGSSVESLIRQHISADPTPIRTIRPAVPSHVAAALERALAKLPADRFNPVAQFAEALAPTPRNAPVDAALIAAPPKGRRRGRSVLILAALLLTLAAVALVSARRLTRGDPSTPMEVVAVLPFSNETGDPEYDQVGKWIAMAIADRLGPQVTSATVLPGELVARTWTQAVEEAGPGREDPVTKVARGLGAGTLVAGSIFATPEGLRLTASLSSEGGLRHVQAVEPVISDPKALNSAVDTVARRALAMVALYLDPSLTGITAELAPMPSLEVYRNFSLAYEAFFRDLVESERYIRATLEEDPTYLLAWTFLAVVLLNRGEHAEADSILGLVGPAWDEMPLGTRAQWTWARNVLDGDRERAFRDLKYYARQSSSPMWTWGWGFESLRTNRPREALDALSLLEPELPPMRSVSSYWADLSQAHHLMGEHDREAEIAVRGRSLHPDRPFLLVVEALAEGARGRAGAILELAAKAPAGSLWEVWTLLSGAMELRAHGFEDDHRQPLETALRRLERPEVKSLERYEVAQLEALFLLEDWRAARSVAERLVAEEPSNVNHLGYLGTIAAHMGDRAEARRISAAIASLDRPYDWGKKEYWQACIATALGDREGAMEHLLASRDEGLLITLEGWWRNAWASLHRDLKLEPLRGYPPFEEFLEPRG